MEDPSGNSHRIIYTHVRADKLDVVVQRKDELLLSEHFSEGVRSVRKQLPGLPVKVHNFDWHGMVKELREKGTVEGLWVLLESIVSQVGFQCCSSKSLSATLLVESPSPRCTPLRLEKSPMLQLQVSISAFPGLGYYSFSCQTFIRPRTCGAWRVIGRTCEYILAEPLWQLSVPSPSE